jgi:hypothetical protein
MASGLRHLPRLKKPMGQMKAPTGTGKPKEELRRLFSTGWRVLEVIGPLGAGCPTVAWRGRRDVRHARSRPGTFPDKINFHNETFF